MALSEPFDLFSGFPGWTTDFSLMWRQEQSRVAGGRTYVKDLGDPLWTLNAQSRQMNPNELDYWRARLNALENGLATFRGYSMSRCYPIAYPRGSWPTGVSFDGVSATLASVGDNRKSVSVDDLPAGFVLSIGDYIQIGDTDLHQVMEAATASVGGVTPVFEVRPHLWPGVEADSPAPAVSVKRPSCVMAIVPGSVSSPADPQTGWGSVSFQAIEAR